VSEPGGLVSAIVVSYNVLLLLRRCLESLLAQDPSPEIVVVDNASSDGTAEAIRREFPQVHLVESAGNLGYGSGINLGVRVSRGDSLLLLNSDTELLPGALAPLSRLISRDGSVGVAAPRLIYSNGRVQPSRRRFPSVGTMFTESTPWQKSAPIRRLLRSFYYSDRPDSHVQAIGWAVGACLLVRRLALEQAGGMDPAYFMYSEEVDLQWRLQQLGWQVVYEPASSVIHHEGKSADQAFTSKLTDFNRAKVVYTRKHFGARAAGALRLSLLIGFGWEMAVERAKLTAGHKPRLRRDRLSAYDQVLRDGLGAGTARPRPPVA
jgi:N-acetylglucosaminyl-diphospho-decaprenol L-rhamnosyltransferase